MKRSTVWRLVIIGCILFWSAIIFICTHYPNDVPLPAGPVPGTQTSLRT